MLDELKTSEASASADRAGLFEGIVLIDPQSDAIFYHIAKGLPQFFDAAVEPGPQPIPGGIAQRAHSL